MGFSWPPCSFQPWSRGSHTGIDFLWAFRHIEQTKFTRLCQEQPDDASSDVESDSGDERDTTENEDSESDVNESDASEIDADESESDCEKWMYDVMNYSHVLL